MYIRSLNIRKYRHIEGIQLGPFNPPGEASDLIVFAGPNGSGKSSVLELISKVLADSWSLTYQMNRNETESSFEACIGLLPSEVETIKKHATPGNARQTEAIEFLDKHHYYFRSFGYEGGEYDANKVLHNNIHNLVKTTFLTALARPLGFRIGSDRSFKKNPYRYQEKFFNYATYSEKQYTWGYAFRSESDQFSDMLDYLITWKHEYFQQLGNYIYQKERGGLQEGESVPIDEYGDVLSQVFPDYSFAHKTENAPSDLFIRIPNGKIIPFSDLSSGEKQVFFTLCFFQRHNVEEAVILIDEPELHLHPSLCRLLLRAMQRLKPRNQIWLATQSADVIDEAGRDRVFFMRRREENRTAEVISATDEAPALQCLRDFFGYTGYIGLARAMIFTEGRNASADRKMFSKLFPQFDREIKFIPATSCSEVERINQAVLGIISAKLGWCEFCLVRDRDYLPQDAVDAKLKRVEGNYFILERHEIENYLLDTDVIAKVLTEVFDKPTTRDQAETMLAEIAQTIAGDVLRDMVSFRLNLRFRPEDFSVPKLFQGKSFINADGEWKEDQVEQLAEKLKSRTQEIVGKLRAEVEGLSFEAMFSSCRDEVASALTSGRWKLLFPGKDLLNGLGQKLGVGKSPVLANSIIKELAATPQAVSDELRRIIDQVVEKTNR